MKGYGNRKFRSVKRPKPAYKLMNLKTFKKSKNVLVLWFKDSAIKKDAKFYTRFVRGDNLSIEGIRKG